MTTTFFLVRHAAHDNVGGYLAGRLNGIALGEAGRAQATRLGQRMTRERFEAIYASPRERAQETAAAISSASSVAPVATEEALDEIHFGGWSGKTFKDLEADPAWRKWNSIRSMCRTPGGETMLDVQRRILGFMETVTGNNRDRTLVLVSHCDVIKAAVSYVLGLPIDGWQRFEIDPASITTIVTGEWGAKLLTLNEVVS